MPEITARAEMGTENAQRMSNAKNREMNPPFVFTGNMNVLHKPEFFVRIWNVSKLEQRIERPWVNWNPAQRARMIIVPAREDGEEVGKPFIIQDVVQVPMENLGNGEFSTRGVDGKFLAQDAINPEDPRGNWKTFRPQNMGTGQNEGTNLYRWGCFWDTDSDRFAQPAKNLIETAVTRMEAHYNYLIDEAKALWGGGDKMRVQIGNTHRMAASYFELEFPWNQIYRAQKECPGCGTKVSKVAVVCSKCPATFDWTQALKLGLRTVAQAIEAGAIEGQAAELATKSARRRSTKKTAA